MTAIESTASGTDKKHERNLTRMQARANSERAREEFAATLNQLEDKLNVPRQFGRAKERARLRLRRLADERPGVLLGAGLSVAVAVGATVWLIVRANLDD